MALLQSEVLKVGESYGEQTKIRDQAYKAASIRPHEKIHEEMITASDAFRTYDLGQYSVILPHKTNWSIFNYLAKLGASLSQEL